MHSSSLLANFLVVAVNRITPLKIKIQVFEMKKSKFFRFGLLLAFSFQLMLLSYCKKYPVNIPERKVKKLVLVVPNGGEELLADSAFAIEWEQENIDSIFIEYSVDNGNSWQFITDDAISSAGLYEWVVPKIESSDYLIRVFDRTDSLFSDTSDATFSVVDLEKKQEQLSYYPLNLGYKWVYKSVYHYGCDQRVGYRIREIIGDTLINGIRYHVINEHSNIPSERYFRYIRVDSSQAKIFVYSTYSNKEYLVMNLTMELGGVIRTVPYSPEWGGLTKFIDKYQGVFANESIEIHKFNWQAFEGNGDYELAENIGMLTNRNSNASGIRDTLIGCVIDHVVYGDTSIAGFTPSIRQYKVISPNGGEVWQAGLEYEIRWGDTGCATDVFISLDNGQTWDFIAGPVYNNFISWTIPFNIQSDSCLIRINGPDNGGSPGLSDINDGIFRIVP